MTATLSTMCACGRRISVPCPTLGDMPSASAEIERQGWIWDDRVGHVCSAACAEATVAQLAELRAGKAKPEKLAKRPTARQADLFGEAAQA